MPGTTIGKIVPGDDIVAKMDQGIDSCTAGLIFISHAWLEGSWVHERVHLAGVAQGGGWDLARSGPAGERRGPPSGPATQGGPPVGGGLRGRPEHPTGHRPKARRHDCAASTYPLGDRPARGRRTDRATVSLLEDHQGRPEGEHTNPMSSQGWLRSLRGVVTRLAILALDSDSTKRKRRC